MYQVTIVYQGAEIGYGEGEGLAYAKREARESVPSIYAGVLADAKYIITRSEI